LAWLVQKDRYAFASSNSAGRPFHRQKVFPGRIMEKPVSEEEALSQYLPLIAGRLMFWTDVDMLLRPE